MPATSKRATAKKTTKTVAPPTKTKSKTSTAATAKGAVSVQKKESNKKQTAQKKKSVTAKKSAPKTKTIRRSATTDPVITPKIKKELNVWLDKHQYWNHDDWCGLLHTISIKGGENLTESQKGRDAIGLYLETNRKPVHN